MDWPTVLSTVTGTAVAVLLIFQRPLARWYRKVRRRRGGVYLWRVDHHRNRARRVTGYVGETVSYRLRSAQHLGRDLGIHGAARQSGQPWTDLNPRMYKIIPLPWWLCWKWVLRPLETLVIMLTWPVYNDAKNRWNPRRITKDRAKLMRLERDQGWAVRVRVAHFVRDVVLLLLSLAGATVCGWMVIYR